MGYAFTDGNGPSAIELINDERVVIAMVGMRFAGTCEVVGDDIFIEGHNGTVVFKRNGGELSGMGLVLRRVDGQGGTPVAGFAPLSSFPAPAGRGR